MGFCFAFLLHLIGKSISQMGVAFAECRMRNSCRMFAESDMLATRTPNLAMNSESQS